MMIKDIADNKAIGEFGAKAILSHATGDIPVRVLTHCNTGSLATAGYGTALGVIRSLYTLKKLGSIQVFAQLYSLQSNCFVNYTFQNMCIALKLDHTIRVLDLPLMNWFTIKYQPLSL